MAEEPTSLIEAPCGCSMTWNRALNMSGHVYCARDRDYALSPRTSIVRQLKEDQDSITIGTPGGQDGAELKVYGDAGNIAAFQTRVEAMKAMRASTVPPKEPKGGKAQP